MFFLRKSKFSGGFFLEKARMAVKRFFIYIGITSVFVTVMILFQIGGDGGRHPVAMAVATILIIGAILAVFVSLGNFVIGGYNKVAEMADDLDEDEYWQACGEAEAAEPVANMFFFTSNVVYSPFGLLVRNSDIKSAETAWIKNNNKNRRGDYKTVTLRFNIKGGKSCEIVLKNDVIISALDEQYNRFKWKMQQLNSEITITENGR